MNEIIIYENGNVSLNVALESETIWLSQKQMSELFGVKVPAINKHISNILASNELDNSTISILEIVCNDGTCMGVKHYNLDMIISVGYRVNSTQATTFRIWATKILKDYLIKGYALNKERLQKDKLDELTNTLNLIKSSLNLANENQAKGFVEIISNYAKSWALLQGYDEQSLEETIEYIILFLSKNQALYKANGKLKINDNALASLTLLVASSKPE